MWCCINRYCRSSSNRWYTYGWIGRSKKAVKPHEIILVVDSMTGQEAVNVAETFNEK